MTHSFRPARRERVQLIIGCAGASGSGKTYSLLMLAVGLAYPEASNAAELQAIIDQEGRNRIAFLDTERGRALHYAPPPGEKPDPWRKEGGWFPFDHCEMEPPFMPDAYTDKIEEADKAGYTVIIVDSGSHEWSGEGGVLEWQEAEQYEKAKRRANYGNNANDKEPSYGDLEAVKMASWIKPKMAHKKMVGRITTLRAHLLIGLRAEQKVKMVQEYNDNGTKKGKVQIISASELPPAERWTPVCEKYFPHELVISFVLGPEAPGVPNILKLQDQHRPFVDLRKPLSAETGRALAAWARGATAKSEPAKTQPERQTREPEAQRQEPPAQETGDASQRADVDAFKRNIQGRRITSIAALQDLQKRNKEWLEWLMEFHPGLHDEIQVALDERSGELTASPTASSGGPSANAPEDRTGESGATLFQEG
jgi:hypothetical protein